MTAAPATGTRTNVRSRADGLQCNTHLRARVESDYRAANPAGKPHARQLDRITAFAAALARNSRTEGPTIHRTYSQIVRGLARAGVPWQPTGSATGDHNRYRNTLASDLGHLQAMGYVESWEPVYDDRRESSGIVIRVAAVVAQLARAPLS